jgi:hypothetical protein
MIVALTGESRFIPHRSASAATPAASSLSPYRKCLGSTSSITEGFLPEAFPIKASDYSGHVEDDEEFYQASARPCEAKCGWPGLARVED